VRARHARLLARHRRFVHRGRRGRIRFSFRC
jgi:hypothetical protein